MSSFNVVTGKYNWFILQLTFEQLKRLGVLTPAVKNLYVYNFVNIPYPWFLCIHGSISVDLTNLRSCSTVVFTEKNPHTSAPTQLKPMLFKGQLY